LALVHVGILLWLVAATGVASYFFHSTDLPLHIQNRAVALSCYTNAALAWTIVQIVLGALLLVLYELDNDWWMGLLLTGMTLLLFIVFGWYKDTIYLFSRVVPNRRTRFWALALTLPIFWLLLSFTIIPGVPGLVLGILVVIDSLA